MLYMIIVLLCLSIIIDTVKIIVKIIDVFKIGVGQKEEIQKRDEFIKLLSEKIEILEEIKERHFSTGFTVYDSIMDKDSDTVNDIETFIKNIKVDNRFKN